MWHGCLISRVNKRNSINRILSMHYPSEYLHTIWSYKWLLVFDIYDNIYLPENGESARAMTVRGWNARDNSSELSTVTWRDSGTPIVAFPRVKLMLHIASDGVGKGTGNWNARNSLGKHESVLSSLTTLHFSKIYFFSYFLEGHGFKENLRKIS